MKCSPAKKGNPSQPTLPHCRQHKSQAHERSNCPLDMQWQHRHQQDCSPQVHGGSSPKYWKLFNQGVVQKSETYTASVFATSAHYRTQLKCAQHVRRVNKINLVHDHLIEFKRYHRSPMSKRVLNSDRVMSARCATLTSSSSVITSFNLQAWRMALSGHPDRQFALYIHSGNENGLRIRLNPDQSLHSASMNCPSAEVHPQVITGCAAVQQPSS